MYGNMNVKFTGICMRKIWDTTDLRIFGNKVVNPTLVLSQLQTHSITITEPARSTNE